MTPPKARSVAVNSQQAHLLLDQYGLRIDLAIIDVEPSDSKTGNGIELLRRLSGNKGSLKLLAVSSGGAYDLELAQGIGADGVLLKPTEETGVSDQHWIEAVAKQIGAALPNFTVRREWLLERSKKLLRQSVQLRESQKSN